MERVSHPNRFRHLLSAPIRRALSLILVIAQMVGVLAPALHTKLQGETRAHVEAGGTHLHYTHDETACPACSAPLGDPVSHTAAAFAAPRRVIVHGAYERSPFAAELFTLSHPRAPPIVDRTV
jgi:hypothetical protein